jgi:hypothetical protein
VWWWVVLLHDDAHPHFVVITKKNPSGIKYEILVSPDFHLFGLLKEALRCRLYADGDKVKEARNKTIHYNLPLSFSCFRSVSQYSYTFKSSSYGS